MSSLRAFLSHLLLKRNNRNLGAGGFAFAQHTIKKYIYVDKEATQANKKPPSCAQKGTFALLVAHINYVTNVVYCVLAQNQAHKEIV